MRKLIVLILVALVLTGCMGPEGQEAYTVQLKTDLASEYKVPISDVDISFLQSCVFDVNSINTIFYVQIKNSKTIYQYTSNDCKETTFGDYVKSVYSEDGKLPEPFEK